MATRFYFPESTAAPVSPPAPEAGWEHIQGSIPTRALLTVANSTTLTTSAYNPDGADHIFDWDSCHRQYVSIPLAAQTLAGNITGQFQTLESHASDNLKLTLKVYLISNDGTTAGDILLAITRSGTEPTTALRNTSFTSNALTSRSVTAGQRLCIEVGLGGLPTSGSGTNCHNGSIRFGTTASSGDLLVNETEAGTTYRPWVEFTQTVTFQYTATTQAAVAVGVATQARTVAFTTAVAATAVGVATRATATIFNAAVQAATAIGVATSSASLQFLASANAVAVGVADFTETVIFGATAAATAIGVATHSAAAVFGQLIAAVAIGIATSIGDFIAGDPPGEYTGFGGAWAMIRRRRRDHQ